jgi:WD40 repeat protein
MTSRFVSIRGWAVACGLALAWAALCGTPARAQQRLDLSHYKGPVRAQVFTPDGAALVTVSAPTLVQGVDGRKPGRLEVKCWDTAAWRERSAWGASADGVWALALSPDGRTLATAGGADDRGGTEVLLRETAGGKVIAALPKQPRGARALVFAPDGKRLATAHEDGAIKVWDVARKRELASLRTGHRLPVEALAFSPDGRTLASGSGTSRIPCGEGTGRLPRGEVKLWDLAVGELRAELHDTAQPAFSGGVRALAFSPDGRTLAVSHGERTLLWEVRTRQARASLLPPAAPGGLRPYAVTAAAFSPDGRALALAYGFNDRGTAREGGVELWDLASGKLRATFREHAGPVEALAFARDSRLLASAGGEVRLWDLRAPPRLGVRAAPRATLQGHNFWAESVAFHPDGKTLASTGHCDRHVRLWDAGKGEALGALSATARELRAVVFAAGGKILVAAGHEHWRNGVIHLWDTATRKLRSTLRDGFSHVGALEVSPDGKTLATVGRNLERFEGDEVILWDLETGKQRLRFPRLKVGEATRVVFSPDGQLLAAGSAEVALFSTATGKAIAGFTVPGGAGAFAFSPDGKTLAVGSLDGEVTFFEVASRAVRGRLRAHSQSIHALTYSPDGKLLVTGGRDGLVKLWDPIPTWPHRAPWLEALATLRGHTDCVWAVTFSPDGHTLATGSQDRTVRLWDIMSK